MDRLDASLQQLKLNESSQGFGDAAASYYFPGNQYMKGFNPGPPPQQQHQPGRRGTPPRFGRFPQQPDMQQQFNAMHGYAAYMNPWCMVSKSENIGIFGAPPNPQDNGRMDNFGTGQRSFRRPYHHNNNNSSSNNHNSHNNTSPWKDSFKTEDELFGTVPKQGINMQLYDNIPVKQSGPDWTPVDPLASFSDIELHKVLFDNIERAQYLHPTPVQKYALPIVLAKRDLMACAQTGSGKTAAFLLPILNMMLEKVVSEEEEEDEASQLGQAGVARPSCLILAPTRELSCQIFDEARRFSYHSDMKPCVVYGGAPVSNQLRDLSRGCDILVATPGRLVDMISREKVSLENVNFLVLDEADRMLDMGFEPQIRKIVEQNGMPDSSERQTLMFSATFPTEIQTLAKDFLHNYIFLAVGRVGSTSENISQEIFYIHDKDKPDLLVRILKEKDPASLALVFVETKKGADLLAQYLSRLQFPVSSIHGDRPQADRERALSSFRTGRTPVLIATAVAARGLDIPNVKHVINFDLPSDIEEYVHRIGRTGRMGQPGSATSFFCDRNQNVARNLVELLRESKQPVPEWLDQRATSSSNMVNGGRRTYGASNQAGQNRRGGFRPNYTSLDFRTGHKTNTSYVQHPTNLGLLGNCAASLACVPPNHLRYAPQQQQPGPQQNHHQNPFAAAVAALGLQQSNAAAAQFGGQPRGLFETRFGTVSPRHGGGGQQQQSTGGQQQQMSLLQAPHQHPQNIMHQQAGAPTPQMHQFFAAAAAANMHAVASTASSSPAIGDFTALTANGNYHHPFSGYPAAFQQHPSGNNSSGHQQQTPADLMQQQMYSGKPNCSAGGNSGNGAVSPAALMSANMMQFYGNQAAYGTPVSQQQHNPQQAALAAAMAMAAAMSNGSQGPPQMDPQMDVGAAGDPEGKMRNGNVGTEWWGATAPPQAAQPQ